MTTADRRRFFRIDDRIGVAYRVLSDEEMRSQVERSASTLDPSTLIAGYDKTIHQLLGQLKIQQPAMGELLEAMDKKLNCVIDLLQMDSRVVEKIVHEMKQVNISACGLAFKVDEPLKAGRVLALDLLLQPENLHLYVHGEVIDAVELEDGRHYVRLEFRAMGVSDQEILIQHIVRRQGAQLRNARTGP